MAFFSSVVISASISSGTSWESLCSTFISPSVRVIFLVSSSVVSMTSPSFRASTSMSVFMAVFGVYTFMILNWSDEGALTCS